MKKINIILNIIIMAFVGAFIGLDICPVCDSLQSGLGTMGLVRIVGRLPAFPGFGGQET